VVPIRLYRWARKSGSPRNRSPGRRGPQAVLLKLRQRLRRGGREEGAATVEFALLIIPFVILVCGLIDFGSALYMKQEVINASRAAARYGTTTIDQNGNHPTEANIIQWVQTNYGSNYQVSAPNAGGTSGTLLTVTAASDITWSFLGSLSDIIHLPIKVSGATTMTLE
jgi:Flp pilus assembly protein TadG